MRIILLCPPAVVINGGIKQIFALADTLCAQGFEAVVFEEQGRRPDWFASRAPVVGQGIFQPRADEVLVLPEDQPQILEIFKSWPQRKVLYSQNHFYGALSLQNVASFADFGISDALCCSHMLFEHVKWRHPAVRAHLVLNGIDRTKFSAPAAPREKMIAYMPRKRPVEAAYIRDIFRYTCPEYAHWRWQPIDNVGEAQAATLMGQAGVFLALSRMESLGLAPLEAMACGAVVAGFTGLGGREFARATNGFWVDEDDFPACVQALRSAVALASLDPAEDARRAYAQACETTLAAYTPELFAQGARAAFEAITAP